LQNDAGISSITTGFPLVFLSSLSNSCC
jgi:hypothetical protein